MSVMSEETPARQRVVERDRWDRPRVARDFDTKVELKIVRRSNVQHMCEANCGRLIYDGTTYARVVYLRGSEYTSRYWNYPIERAYHWECTPDDVTKLLPLFFPNQEWKAVS